MFNVKQEFYVTLNVKNFDKEVDILRLFRDTIEIMEMEDPSGKILTSEVIIKCTWDELMKYKKVREIMFS